MLDMPVEKLQKNNRFEAFEDLYGEEISSETKAFNRRGKFVEESKGP